MELTKEEINQLFSAANDNTILQKLPDGAEIHMVPLGAGRLPLVIRAANDNGFYAVTVLPLDSVRGRHEIELDRIRGRTRDWRRHVRNMSRKRAATYGRGQSRHERRYGHEIDGDDEDL